MRFWSSSRALWESWDTTGAKRVCALAGEDPEMERRLNSSERILPVDVSQSKTGPEGGHFIRAQLLGNALCKYIRKFTSELKIWTVSLIVKSGLRKISKWHVKCRSRV